MNWLTLPSYLFGQGVDLRDRLYKSGWLKSFPVDCSVISVGNITVGGTGKTPFSIWLLGHLLNRGLKPAFVSRGYGSSRHGVRRVKEIDPIEFGDEPSLVLQTFPQIPVYVGADRVATIGRLLEDVQPNVIITDDAFQHRRLQRDLDIVVLDAMEPRWHYDFLPAGRAREKFSALKRAQWLVVSKFNLAGDAQLEFLRKKTEDFAGRRLQMTYHCAGFERAGEKRNELPGRIFLVTGVGRPESVEKLLESSQSTQHVAQHKIYPDHCAYSSNEADEILNAFRSSKCDHLVVTAKDAVKLRRWPGLKDLIWQMDLEVKVQGDVNELDREIDRLVRTRP